MLSERRFDTGTVELNYGEGPPNGPPFVILHGGAGSWHYADDLIALLVARWHVYAPDFRGHGLSGRVPGRYNLRDYAADTAAFLAGVVREPAVVYGHSLGGEVAIMAAAMQPGLFRAVIHGDVAFSTDDHAQLARRRSSTCSTWRKTSSGIASPGGRRPRSRAPCGTCRCSCRGSRSRSERGTRSVRTTPGSSFKR